MNVTDLNREQLIELKQNYMAKLVNEGLFAEAFNVDYDEPSYWDLANADKIVPDDVIFHEYDHIDYSPDDFFCTAGGE